MNIQNFKRVFIHEIGHYIARELNYKIYKIGLGVESIYIKPQEFNGTKEYLGWVKPKKPENYVENGEIENPTKLIAVLLYGCIYQTLYLKLKFYLCFNLNNGANGKSDLEHFMKMGKYCSEAKRNKIVEFIQMEYLETLNADQNHLEKLFELDPLKFVDETSGEFIVNLNLLKKSLSNFIIEHEKYYRDFINNIERIKNER